jgi:glyoxylase-like metal-dependent hydrolase (beta-lactamase superfamily II)
VSGPERLHFSDERLDITKVVVGPLENNVFVVRCRHTGQAAMVDAADEPGLLLDLSKRLGVGVVIQTHGHWDHVQAVPHVRRAGYPVGVHAADADMLDGYDFVIDDGAVIEVGRLRLRALHTPGHTPGSTCFLVEGSPVVLSGDTLFPGGPGKTAGAGGDFQTIIRSIEERLFDPLPDDTVVMPGHGDDTSIGRERPHLQEWVERGW